jgi:hypothetical protein
LAACAASIRSHVAFESASPHKIIGPQSCSWLTAWVVFSGLMTCMLHPACLQSLCPSKLVFVLKESQTWINNEGVDFTARLKSSATEGKCMTAAMYARDARQSRGEQHASNLFEQVF